MADLPIIASKGIANNVETFMYSAGSYDRLKSDEGILINYCGSEDILSMFLLHRRTIRIGET